ncbi:hypothetical protein RRSWK_03205 [Rhodopirellula sp. SWK7]|nr:hypothetical protein RRSWK_03205 [Rhodopirellula sp. SWK7]
MDCPLSLRAKTFGCRCRAMKIHEHAAKVSEVTWEFTEKSRDQ